MKKTFWILLISAIVGLLTGCRKNNDPEKILPPLTAAEGTGKFYINDTVPFSTFNGEANLYQYNTSLTIQFTGNDATTTQELSMYAYLEKPELQLNTAIPIDIVYNDTIADWRAYYCKPHDSPNPTFVKSGTLIITDTIRIDDFLRISGTFTANEPLCLTTWCPNDIHCVCCTKTQKITIKGGVFTNVLYKKWNVDGNGWE